MNTASPISKKTPLPVPSVAPAPTSDAPVERKFRASVLVADDEATTRSGLAALLRGEGYDVELAASGYEALAKLETSVPDALVTDMRMPGIDGLMLLEKARELHPELIVVVMTAFGGVETAVKAMRMGAEDYLTKPLQIDELVLVLERALERRSLRRETSELRARLGERLKIDNLIGRSPAMQSVLRVIEQVAPTRASVLITGESGTGKELVAQAIHENSPRSRAPFVKLHCAALAESVLESELFGHEKGSFTGASGRREGRFFQANGGTLFLDEIGDVSPAVQVKLLRFLQERTFERVGGSETLKVDVRMIAATNRNLKAEVEAGRFREDLFYRLNVVNIEVPPLRARPGDVLELAHAFLQRFAKENKKSISGFDAEALQMLSAHRWPGNVRELENMIERAVVMCSTERIGIACLPPSLGAETRGGFRVPGSTMAELERHAILATLEAAGGSTVKAARILDISVRKIQYKLREYGVSFVRQPAKNATNA